MKTSQFRTGWPAVRITNVHKYAQTSYLEGHLGAPPIVRAEQVLSSDSKVDEFPGWNESVPVTAEGPRGGGDGEHGTAITGFEPRDDQARATYPATGVRLRSGPRCVLRSPLSSLRYVAAGPRRVSGAFAPPVQTSTASRTVTVSPTSRPSALRTPAFTGTM